MLELRRREEKVKERTARGNLQRRTHARVHHDTTTNHPSVLKFSINFDAVWRNCIAYEMEETVKPGQAGARLGRVRWPAKRAFVGEGQTEEEEERKRDTRDNIDPQETGVNSIAYNTCPLSLRLITIHIAPSSIVRNRIQG